MPIADCCVLSILGWQASVMRSCMSSLLSPLTPQGTWAQFCLGYSSLRYSGYRRRL